MGRKEERPAELRGRERDQAEHEPGGMPFRQRVFGKLFCDCEKGVPVSEGYATITEVKKDIFEYVEMFYNRKRMHSYLGYMRPVEYRLAHSA